ncbi:MAG: hypothetical protein HKUEN07_20520 [Rhodocyclaceae bacterium]|nr:MAG: hypothetical protein HKUEN07_20520 [Rhodocyclaceae bacterium]
MHAVDPQIGFAALGHGRRLAGTDFLRGENVLSESAIHLAAADAAKVMAAVADRRFREGQAAELAGHGENAKKEAPASLRTLLPVCAGQARASCRPIVADISLAFIRL